MAPSELLILLVLAVFFLWIFYPYKSEYILVKSYLDNQSYLVLDRPDRQEASNLLASVNLKIQKFIKHLEEKKNSSLAPQILNLKNRYHPSILSENGDHHYTSYSLNKKYIFLCLRQRKLKSNSKFIEPFPDTLVDENVLMYVVLHELAHLSTDHVVLEHQHQTDKTFRELFQFYIDTAEEIGIYNPINFREDNRAYCGMVIRTG